jgi:hypothetical protein
VAAVEAFGITGGPAFMIFAGMLTPAVVHSILMVGGIGGDIVCALCLSGPAQEKGSHQEAGFFEQGLKM